MSAVPGLETAGHIRDWRAYLATLQEQERRAARDSLAIYAGLHIPAEVERDDLPALHELPVAARYIPAQHHRLLLDKLADVESGKIKRLVVSMPPGSAKALALDTPVPTPEGWSTMGALRVGDRVFDDQGCVCRVTWISPIFLDRPVYSVTTDCGDRIIADQDHEWLVRLCGKPGSVNRKPFKIKETWELDRRRAKRPMIMRAAALQLSDISLPLDPYVLGVWLGDGTSSVGAITSSLEDQVWLRSEFERLGYQTKDRSVPTLFGVSDIRRHLVALGVLNDPFHNTHGRKHIPAMYLRAGTAQRLALLQGLIDTDGTVCKQRGCATFCNTNRELAEQVRELVRSLGVKAGWSEGRATLNGKDCGPVYRVGFYLDEAARLPRKRVLCRNQYRTPNTYIDVVPAGIADTVCIEVDSPSHLYLCGRSMTPTHNSTYASTIFPAWCLGRHPDWSIIAASQTQELADRFGRRARNLVGSTTHAEVFGSGLAPDQRAAGHWETAKGGEYHATGVQPFAGRRADGVICDDLLRGRKDAESKLVRESVWEWYLSDIRPRLKPGAWLVMIATRWIDDDPIGRILPPEAVGKSGWYKSRDGEDWYVLSLAAVIETVEQRDNDPLGREIGDILWPEWFTPEMLEQERRTQGARNWAALYQQNPRPQEGAILKRVDWRQWPGDKPPKCEYVVSVYDTAFEEGEENDYTARTTWGVFWHEEERPAELQALAKSMGKLPPTGRYCCVLLERFKDRVEFPKLRVLALKHYKEFKPDRVLIEKKASGHSLIQEMRRAGVPVGELKADRSKLARAHAASAVLESGCVFYMPRKWADEVRDECEAFPAGEHDDITDTCVHAWIWLRRTFHLQLREEDDEDEVVVSKRRFYG